MDPIPFHAAAVIDWRAVAVLASFIVAWSGVMFWGAKHLLSRLEGKLDRESGEWRRVEAELNALRAALPREYVMREDWIRFGATIDAKVDRLFAKIEELKDKIHERDRP